MVEQRFGVVVPVKTAERAKSRLAPLGDRVRRELVVAFALDTVTAALECPLVEAVLVVTDEVPLALGLRELGVSVIPDGVAQDLNASLEQGAAELVRRHPHLRPVAVCADLPCLDPAELATVLGCADRGGFVRDEEGVGTTLYAAVGLADFRPRFGPGSAVAHEAAGRAEVNARDCPTVRRDVDTPADLRSARALGVRAHTSLVCTLHQL